MYPPHQSISRYLKAAHSPIEASSWCAPIVHIPALDMVVWAFPNERKLASLPHLIDDGWLRACVLPVLVAGLHGPDWRLTACAHEVVHYVPEHTCTVRAVLDAQHADGRRQRSVAYGKAYYDDAGRHVGDAMRQLWQSRAVQSGALGIARPLLYVESDRILWQEGLQGDTLEQRYPDDRMPPAALRRVAGAIAALHASPVAHIPRQRPIDALADLRERADVIAGVRPLLRARLDHIVRVLGAALPGPAPLATLHGDLHPKNVFLMGDRVCLIDLDNIRRGSAEHDLASWIACMLYRAALRREHVESVLVATHAFVREYARERGTAIDAHALDRYTAVTLVSERAYRVLSRLKDGRLEILDELLELALRAAHGRLLHAAPEGQIA